MGSFKGKIWNVGRYYGDAPKPSKGGRRSFRGSSPKSDTVVSKKRDIMMPGDSFPEAKAKYISDKRLKRQATFINSIDPTGERTYIKSIDADKQTVEYGFLRDDQMEVLASKKKDRAAKEKKDIRAEADYQENKEKAINNSIDKKQGQVIATIDSVLKQTQEKLGISRAMRALEFNTEGIQAARDGFDLEYFSNKIDTAVREGDISPKHQNEVIASFVNEQKSLASIQKANDQIQFNQDKQYAKEDKEDAVMSKSQYTEKMSLAVFDMVVKNGNSYIQVAKHLNSLMDNKDIDLTQKTILLKETKALLSDPVFKQVSAIVRESRINGDSDETIRKNMIEKGLDKWLDIVN